MQVDNVEEANSSQLDTEHNIRKEVMNESYISPRRGSISGRRAASQIVQLHYRPCRKSGRYIWWIIFCCNDASWQ